MKRIQPIDVIPITFLLIVFFAFAGCAFVVAR